MGVLASTFQVSHWGIAPIGAGDALAYFDPTVDQDVDAVMIKLVFGATPEVYSRPRKAPP